MSAEEVSRGIHLVSNQEGGVQFSHSAFNKTEYEVIPITNNEVSQWVMKKHYAHRMPSINYSFGLFSKKKKVIVGVCTFGLGANYRESEAWKPFALLELVRLCINEDIPRNGLSFLVSSSLKMLPTPRVIVSYADIEFNHCGYIYQATNWIYTGIGALSSKKFLIDGEKELHNRASTYIKVGNGITSVRSGSGKHRYYYFIGTHKEKKQMMQILKKRWYILEYPKGKPNHYNSSCKMSLQQRLVVE